MTDRFDALGQSKHGLHSESWKVRPPPRRSTVSPPLRNPSEPPDTAVASSQERGNILLLMSCFPWLTEDWREALSQDGRLTRGDGDLNWDRTQTNFSCVRNESRRRSQLSDLWIYLRPWTRCEHLLDAVLKIKCNINVYQRSYGENKENRLFLWTFKLNFNSLTWSIFFSLGCACVCF